MSVHLATLSSLGLSYRWKLQIFAEDTKNFFYIFVSPNDTLELVLKAASEMSQKLYQVDVEYKHARSGSGADLDPDFRVMQILSYDEQLHVASTFSAFQSSFPTAEYLRRVAASQTASPGSNGVYGFPFNASAILMAPEEVKPVEVEEESKKKRKTRASRKSNPKAEPLEEGLDQGTAKVDIPAEKPSTPLKETGISQFFSIGAKNPKSEEHGSGLKALPSLNKPSRANSNKGQAESSSDRDAPAAEAGPQDVQSTKKKSKKTA